MENSVVENGVCSAQTASNKVSESSSVDHLVVMVHGILGRATDWKFAAELFAQTFHDKIIVHCSERNVATLTLDGIDVMGERLAKEVVELIHRKPSVRRISFVAHSVGGLVARYAIGKLYRPPMKENGDMSSSECEEERRGTIYGLEALNFITFATPHLGSRGSKQVPFLFGVSAFEKAASCVVHCIFGRTGRHLFLTDNVEGKSPLLKRMVEDNDEGLFMSALCSFNRRVVYSNVSYDNFVGWATSSIRCDSELPRWETFVNCKYPHIVYEEYCKACPKLGENIFNKLEDELVTSLSYVSWEKVDVSFRKSWQRFAAHSVIQAKGGSKHKEGVDVIHHMLEKFLL